MSGPDLISEIQRAGAAIAPLHDPIQPIREGDWLCNHPEPGQSFLEFLGDDPILPTRDRTSLYLQPIGEFAGFQAVALNATVDILGRFYGLPVRLLDPIDSAIIPPWARRQNPNWGQEQFLTRFILDHLAENKPGDAVAVLGLTTTDLWPGEGWNFMFGEASFTEGVGVWSLYRMGDPELESKIFLRRTLKIAIHETGHMFGIRHCTDFDCGMNGANHQEEADRQPIWFCPEDEMKIWYGFGSDAAERYRSLADFSDSHAGLEDEATFWRWSEQAVRESEVQSSTIRRPSA